MKITLVQMPPQPRDTPPMELALCAAVLRRAGHEVTVRDVNNELFHETFKQRPFWKFRLTDHSADPAAAIPLLEEQRLRRHAAGILAGKPDAVVFKAGNVYAAAAAMARLLQAQAPGLPLVASGLSSPDPDAARRWRAEQDASDAYGQKVMPFDCLILGEDELALPAALARRFPLEDRVVDATQGPFMEDLDELPFLDYSDYDFKRYSDRTTARLSVSRGCPKRCSFCQDWVTVRKYRSMSAERWLAEYRHQHERHPGLVHFRHYDRLLNGDMAALEAFCDRLLAAYPEPPVAWGGDFIIRPEMTDALIAKLSRARCNSFGTGLESGSERVRRSVRKGFFSNALAARVLRSCRSHGIPVSLNVMVGLPAETRADLRETIGFLERSRQDIAEVRLTSPTTLLQPGTPLAASLASSQHEKWQTPDGGNTYVERVRRFQELCERVLSMGGPRLAVNRRTLKNPAALRRLVAECLEAEPGRAAPGRQLARQIRMLGPWHHQIELRGLGTRDVYPDDSPGRDVPQKTMPKRQARIPLELKGKTVLDVGCSDGWHALQAKAQGAALVYGIDTDAPSIRRADFAQQTLGLSGVAFRTVNAFVMDHWAAQEPALAGRRFDWAFLLDMLDHVPHPALLLEKTAAVADRVFLSLLVDKRAPGSALLWGPERIAPSIIRPVWVPTKKCLPELLESAGFTRFEELSSRKVVAGLDHVFAAARKD
ncbi:MAG: radical SAM protein [Elusimicrobia bacterium]|nr:radical SAM protein [Elusimicrobiota bacterium]